MAILNQITPETFVKRLESELCNVGSISISVNNQGVWPSFEISSRSPHTVKMTGFYTAGNSYLQISHSGREEFTGDEPSSERFLELIKRIVDVLAEQGCVEKQWTTSSGVVKRSTMELPVSRPGALPHNAVYHLGKSPHFWQMGLRLSEKRFLPFK
jgi:hypothetical protein